jgi:hypothetical protein
MPMIPQAMQGGPPPELAAMLAERMAGGAPPEAMMGPPGAPPDGPPDQLQALQQVIGDLHQLLVTLQDPADVQAATQALGVLTRIQQRQMAQAQG